MLGEDRGVEERLRPRSLDEFVGQQRICENLGVFLEAARARRESVDHLLFYGPPGLGKTALAGIVANEMGAQLKATSGPVIERPGDLAALLSNLEQGDVLFIDEIHRLSPAVEEILYPAMEDFQLDLVIGQGPERALRAPRPAALHARRRHHARGPAHVAAARPIRLYGTARVLSAGRAGPDPRACGASPRDRARARCGGGDRRPRARDAAHRQSAAPPRARLRRGAGRARGIELAHARFALEKLDVDEAGFDGVDRSLLLALLQKFDGGPVGLDTLAAALGEDRGTLEDLVEPFLIQGGYLDRTPRGRVATRLAWEHFGLSKRAPQLL